MENVTHATSTRSTTRGRYVGPSAARIAELIAPEQRVRFERGWFWTAAVCHDSEQDQLAFRQRPDGDGIDVRCKSAGCSRERIIRSLEATDRRVDLVGLLDRGLAIGSGTTAGWPGRRERQHRRDRPPVMARRPGAVRHPAAGRAAGLRPRPRSRRAERVRPRLGSVADSARVGRAPSRAREGRPIALIHRDHIQPTARAVSPEAALVRCPRATPLTRSRTSTRNLRKETSMTAAATTATIIVTAPRPTLEELVDRIIDADLRPGRDGPAVDIPGPGHPRGAPPQTGGRPRRGARRLRRPRPDRGDRRRAALGVRRVPRPGRPTIRRRRRLALQPGDRSGRRLDAMRDGGAPGRGRPGDALAAGQGSSRGAASEGSDRWTRAVRRESRDQPGSTSPRSSAAIRWAT